jgi:hypothetical protein
LKEIKNKYVELSAIAVTAILKFILMDWLNQKGVYIAGVCIFWLFYIRYRQTTNRFILKYWGFKGEHFKTVLSFLIPLVLIIALLSIAYSYYRNGWNFSWHIIPILLLYPVWGIIQQYLMLGIISHNLIALLKMSVRKYVVIFFVSTLFALIHYPNPLLMLLTFWMEVLFIWIYLKWRNLWAIGIAHGWMGTFLLYYVMERDLWVELFSPV